MREYKKEKKAGSLGFHLILACKTKWCIIWLIQRKESDWDLC